MVSRRRRHQRRHDRPHRASHRPNRRRGSSTSTASSSPQGFIDIHTHARRGIFELPTADNYTRQGVTTLIEGPDGGSPLPLKPFLDKIAALGIAPNFATFIGQGTIRGEVIGDADRAATREEIEKMRGARPAGHGGRRVRAEFGPVLRARRVHTDRRSDRARQEWPARWAASTSRTCATKPRADRKRARDDRDWRAGRLPTQVTHHKVVGKAYWGGSVDTLRLIDEARARGVDATIDQYPYTASSTNIGSALCRRGRSKAGARRR